MSTEGSDALAKTATAEATPTIVDGVAARAIEPHKRLGRYQLGGELGAGGMGVVHAAFDPELERRVAIKVLLKAGNTDARARLLREARSLAKLTHPNVVSVYEVGTEDGRDYVAMELVDGANLSEWLRSEKRDTKQISTVFAAAARGLAAAHAAGLVHRDFKPHNVLRCKTGRVLVTDFGLALAAERADSDVARLSSPARHMTLTATGSWIGTPAYMAPEQWNGTEVGPAADQFAFCVALWEALAGERPFRGETIEALRDAALRGPSSLDMKKVPARFRPLFRRGLDPDPAKRYRDMETVANLVETHAKSIAWMFWLALIVVVALFAVGAISAVIAALQQPDRTSDSHIDPLIKQVRRFSDGHVTAPQESILRTIRELKLGEAVRLVPAIKNGQPIGMKIFRVKPATFLDAIGLANGDVLTALNEEPTLTDEQTTKALDELRYRHGLRLHLLRDSKPLTITLQEPGER